jgi:Protein of unknown function (DUF4239)
MIYFLTSHPLWLSGAMIIGLGILLSMLGPALVRRYVDIKRLTANNEVAGFKFATIGVLYAVLLAFAIIVVWQKFSDAEVNVVREAGAAENLYRLSQGLNEKTGVAVRGAVAKYLKVTMDDDWPAMDRGTAVADGAAKQTLFTRRCCRRMHRATAPWLRKCFVSSMSLRRHVAPDWWRRRAPCRTSYGWSCRAEPRSRSALRFSSALKSCGRKL